jgi:ABC-2 type transport system permease protein
VDADFLVLTAVTFSLFGFIIGIWADGFREAADDPDAGGDAADLPRRQLLFGQHAAVGLAQRITLLNPVVYLISGFRWSFYEIADVSVGLQHRHHAGISFLAACMIVVWWIFKTGYRLKN